MYRRHGLRCLKRRLLSLVRTLDVASRLACEHVAIYFPYGKRIVAKLRDAWSLLIGGRNGNVTVTRPVHRPTGCPKHLRSACVQTTQTRSLEHVYTGQPETANVIPVKQTTRRRTSRTKYNERRPVVRRRKRETLLGRGGDRLVKRIVFVRDTIENDGHKKRNSAYTKIVFDRPSVCGANSSYATEQAWLANRRRTVFRKRFSSENGIRTNPSIRSLAPLIRVVISRARVHQTVKVRWQSGRTATKLKKIYENVASARARARVARTYEGVCAS